jgi:glycosyltransferase involved in cell wall biosynthesis
MFIAVSLVFDRQPPFKTADPADPVTILIACRNEEKIIANTLQYIRNQDYRGPLHVIVVDNASADKTAETALEAGKALGIDIQVLFEEKPGKFNALNKGLEHINTEFVVSLDADTLLHKSAIRYLVSRIKSAPKEVCAVAGSVLVRNSRKNLLTRLQEWDYFLGIASIKRMQGLYQGTFCWMPGLILAFFGRYWIVGPATLFVVPLALVQNYILYNYQREVFRKLDLRIRRNHLGFGLYVLVYQMLMSPMSVIGYCQELLMLRRKWK